MQTTCALIRTSVAREHDAKELARAALDLRLAACVQILGPGLAIYRWQGKVEEAEEYFLSFKTSAGKSAELMDWLAARHPYDVPEIICTAGTTTQSYGDWLLNETASNVNCKSAGE